VANVILDIAAACAFLASVASIAYTIVALIGLSRYRRAPAPRAETFPAVTIFKPLCGAEEQLYENLRSFCDQDYPEFQVVFGVSNPDDPAIAVVESLRAAFPERDLVMVVGGTARMSNPKVANLANMAGAAKHDLYVIADSDMRVDRRYLRSVVAPFADARVGAATCLYRGLSTGGIASELGAMHIQDEFAPSVLVAAALDKLRFCFGATMAVRRAALEEIGGFAALGSYLADDYMLGKLISERGYDIDLPRYVVANLVHEPNLRSLWLHELRWARTIRTVRPVGYAFSVITNGLPLASIFLALSRNVAAGLALLTVVAALRVTLHYAARATFGATGRATPWLIPLRDLLSCAIWVASFFGRGARWRQRALVIQTDGRI